MAVNVCLTKNGKAHLSRSELLDWVNDCLQTEYHKIEQMCSGVAYCQLMYALYPQSLQLKRIKTNASCEYEYMENFKLLKKAFDFMRVNKIVPFNDLVKGRFHDNLEFMQWFKKFYEANCKDNGDNAKVSEDDFNGTARTYTVRRSSSMATKKLSDAGDGSRRPQLTSSNNSLKKRLQRSYTISQIIGDGKSSSNSVAKKKRCPSSSIQTLESRRRNSSQLRKLNTSSTSNNPPPFKKNPPSTKNSPRPVKNIQKSTPRAPSPVKQSLVPLTLKELEAKVMLGRENIQYMKAVNRFYLHKIRNIMGLCLENNEPELQDYAKRVLYIISRKTSCISLDPDDDADYADE